MKNFKKKVIRGTEAKPNLVKYTHSSGNFSFQIEFDKKLSTYNLTYRTTKPFTTSEEKVDLKSPDFLTAEHNAAVYLSGVFSGIEAVCKIMEGHLEADL